MRPRRIESRPLFPIDPQVYRELLSLQYDNWAANLPGERGRARGTRPATRGDLVRFRKNEIIGRILIGSVVEDLRGGVIWVVAKFPIRQDGADPLEPPTWLSRLWRSWKRRKLWATKRKKTD